MGGGERGAREARGSEDILTWVGGREGARVGGRGREGREGDRGSEEILSWDTTL